MGHHTRRLVLGSGLFVVCLLVAWPLVERQRAKSALAKYERALKAKGERLTFPDLLPVPPEGENKYLDFLGILAALQSGPAMISNPPPMMKLIVPGKVLAVTKEPHWVIKGQKTPLGWEQAEADLKENAAALAQLREILRSPVLRFGVQYRGARTMFPHLAQYTKVTRWLSGSSMFNVHKGDLEGAISDIEAILLLITVEHEPFLISQVVRIAVMNMALNTAWHAIQSDRIGDEQLARFQEMLKVPEFVGPMIVALEGERVMSRDAIRDVRAAELDMKNLFGAAQLWGDDESSSGLEKVIPYHDEVLGAIRSTVILPIWRFAWSYEDERHVLEEVQRILEAGRRAQSQRAASIMDEAERALEKKSGDDGEFRSWRYLVTGLFIPGSSKGLRRAFSAETQRELAITAIALKRYHLRHGAFPKSLDELTPALFATHPVDWMDGQKLRYRKEGASFVLWSVGEDREDDDGVPNQASPYVWTSGPDLVWPQPASKEEVGKHYAEHAAGR